ncbi:MAG: hypothetical protein Q4D23_11135 [Bacteroidales bacterium]|nr:hypothetical protein [Bacteroidales bacterium]
MKYFLAIMACMMLDVIEPVGCSRDTESVPSGVDTQVETPTQTPAE